MILALLLSLAISCTPTPSPLDGCAGYCYTPPSACEARYLLDYLTTRPPGPICDDPALQCGVPTCEAQPWGGYRCRYWSRLAGISCACVEKENPPPGQVWRKVT